MEIVKRIEDVVYASSYWWNPSINKLATIENGLPNCTTFVVGAIKKASMPDIVSRYSNAGNWHKYLINGWVCVPYSEHKNNIKVGDVIEWSSGNHVAIVSDTSNGIWVSGSFYTGIHGKSMYGDSFDTREGISSLKQLNDFFLNQYQYRYFHFVPLDEESKWCGGEPDYVLIAPNAIMPTERNKSKNQVYVGTNGLRVRTEPNTSSDIRGIASIGYYDAEKVEGGEYEGGTTWYKVNEYYIAGVNGVVWHPKEDIAPMEQMVELMKQMQDSFTAVCNERDEYKDMIERIRRIVI